MASEIFLWSYRSLYHYYAGKGIVSMYPKIFTQINAIFEHIPKRHLSLTKLKINHNKLTKVLTPSQSTGP